MNYIIPTLKAISSITILLERLLVATGTQLYEESVAGYYSALRMDFLQKQNFEITNGMDFASVQIPFMVRSPCNQ